jgi:CAAX protease family protein
MGVLKFFLLTFGLTWTWWIAAAVLLRGTASAPDGLDTLLFLPGTVAPALVALALTPRDRTPDGQAALLGRVLNWRVGARWYVFAIAYLGVLKLAAALIQRVATGAWPAFSTAWYIGALAIPISMWVQAGEEIGWRGYALPRLAGRFGLGPATVLLGAIWACWHLPLFFLPGADTSGQSFVVYLLQVTALSVAMGWLYWQTRGSLLLVMLMHAAVNNTKDIVPSAVSGATSVFTLSGSLVVWLTVVLLWIGAASFLVGMRGGHLDYASSAASDARTPAGVSSQ